MNKSDVLLCIQAVLNEYQHKEWFKKHELTPVNDIFQITERFDNGSTQGHIGIINKKMVVTFQGSDDTEPGNPDWVGSKGNFNFAFSPFQPLDSITNTVPTTIRVHTGHYLGYKEVKQNILNLINKYNPEELWVTGHSRGCAHAEICAENMAFKAKVENAISPKKIYYVGVSGNRVGNQDFVNSLMKMVDDYVKFWLGEDPVPKQPWPIFGYRHPDKCIRFKNSRANGFLSLLRFVNPIGWPNDHFPDYVQYEAKRELPDIV